MGLLQFQEYSSEYIFFALSKKAAAIYQFVQLQESGWKINVEEKGRFPQSETWIVLLK